MSVHAYGSQNTSTPSYVRSRARIHALRYHAGCSCSRISRQLNTPAVTIQSYALTRVTPQKPRGRLPLVNSPLRRRLISHATASHEQKLKPLREVAHELSMNVDQLSA
jgi:hypothetical protein